LSQIASSVDLLSASEMTCVVSAGALNYSLAHPW